MTKATRQRTVVDVLKDQKRLQKKTYGLGRQNLAGYSSVSGGLAVFHQGSTADSGGGNVTSLIKKTGDSMIGPLGFLYSDAKITSGGEIDCSIGGSYSSRNILESNSGTTDNVVRISGSSGTSNSTVVAPDGQLIFLQGKSTDTITLKHYTDESTTKGNIYIPSGSDYELAGKEIVLLQWDTVNKNPAHSLVGTEFGQWTLVATSQGSGVSGADTDLSNLTATGEAHFANPELDNLTAGSVSLNTDISMNTYDITDICRLQFDLTGTDTLDAAVMGIDGTSSRMHFNVPSGDEYAFTIAGLSSPEKVIIDNTDLRLQTYLRFDNHTTTATPTDAAVGYISVKIGTSVRKLYYY